jgi:hypothetical protein
MVLRYAAPALGLIVVAAIGFVVLRRESPRSSEHVSQIQPAQSESTRVAEQVESNEQKQKGLVDNSGQSADSAANKEVQRKDSSQPSTATVPQPTPADAIAQNAPATKAPAPKPEAQPVVVAAEPPSPARAKLDDVSEKRQENEDAVRKQQAEVKVAKDEETKQGFVIDGAKKGDIAAPITTRSRAAKNKTVTGDLASAQGAAAPGAARRETDEAGRDDKDNRAETRSVAGHQFRKQGGVWVDTTYDSSGSITTYRRDSESYRSLIADEPTIKTIADQLDGEIIVVWKGRAYRIR